MDVQIRYWNETARPVDTQFFDSQFLSRPIVCIGVSTLPPLKHPPLAKAIP